MKGSLLWKFMYLFCAMAGMLAGYGVFTLASSDGVKPNTITKDDTLVREAGDSVFFGADEEKTKQPEISVPTKQDSIIREPVSGMLTSPTPVLIQSTPEVVPHKITVTPTVTPVPVVTQAPVGSFHDSGLSSAGASDVPSDRLPSLGLQWAATGETVPELTVPSVTSVPQENQVAETITYPAKIFGQTPIINRSDAYVSYFEFCYDLIAMVEQEVAARGLNLNTLMTKFALKALFCGVDIEKLDINAPIPKRQAALCLWLAAQVLEERGCDTSANSAAGYVTDISTCSASERKAIAYLYEQGVVKGYQVAGQRFYPQNGLKTEAGKQWLANIKQCWK